MVSILHSEPSECILPHHLFISRSDEQTTKLPSGLALTRYAFAFAASTGLSKELTLMFQCAVRTEAVHIQVHATGLRRAWRLASQAHLPLVGQIIWLPGTVL